jgi:hypothetical protein
VLTHHSSQLCNGHDQVQPNMKRDVATMWIVDNKSLHTYRLESDLVLVGCSGTATWKKALQKCSTNFAWFFWRQLLRDLENIEGNNYVLSQQ